MEKTECPNPSAIYIITNADTGVIVRVASTREKAEEWLANEAVNGRCDYSMRGFALDYDLHV